MELRPFQRLAIDDIVSFFSTAERGHRRCYSAPTGCGKSIVELEAQRRLDGCWIVTPRQEIVDGMLEKGGAPERITTPMVLHNRLMSGAWRAPDRLIIDESHHETAETYRRIDLLCGLAPAVGLTATPFRGSPRGTREFLERWGEPIPLITFMEAVGEGYISCPTFTVLPLVDDDVIDISNGEFTVTSIDGATVDRLGDLAEHSRSWYDGRWDVPTIYACPSSVCCHRLAKELAERGLPSAIVAADTPRDHRRAAFLATVERAVALLHINIVSEGVDLPLRRLVDLAPTLSPVRWMQQVGRITRPGGKPEYVGCNRNLLRHAYAMEGAVPVSAVVDAEKLFGPQKRAHTRALGLEAVGRFKPESVLLLNGATASVYSLSVPISDDTGRVLVVEYCCIVPPVDEPVWASKVNRVVDGKLEYGAWTPAEPPKTLQGFSSIAPRELSEKQLNWWSRSAARYGIDPEQDVTRKNFQVLPVLSDTGRRL